MTAELPSPATVLSNTTPSHAWARLWLSCSGGLSSTGVQEVDEYEQGELVDVQDDPEQAKARQEVCP